LKNHSYTSAEVRKKYSKLICQHSLC